MNKINPVSQHDDDTWRGEPTITGERANFERYRIFVQLIVAIQKKYTEYTVSDPKDIACTQFLSTSDIEELMTEQPQNEVHRRAKEAHG